jgi:glutamate-1-semialdehyde 2,1-aminomutase
MRDIEAAAARYADRNPASRALYEQACAYMPGGNTRSALYWSPFPLYVTQSEGCRVRDADGHEYLDVLGEYTAGLYGHSDPVIADSVARTVAGGYSNGAPAASEIQLAQLICKRFPSVASVRFCNSGTEANLYALTLARLFTGRSKLLACSGAYHGGVFAFAGGGNPMNAPFDWTLAKYNDTAVAVEVIDRLGSELAAVIVEPMLSNGGCIPADMSFLRALRQKCSEVGALLIFDEIVTSRMSAGGLQQRLAITPDMTTFGKYFGAGFSSGAFGGRADVMNLLNPNAPRALMHSGTFNNNVYSMTVGYAALSSVFTPERAEALYADGEILRARLNDVARAIAPSVQFTGCGSIMNIHFHRGAIRCPEDLAAEPKELLRLFHLDMLQEGVYAATRGQINLSLPMRPRDFDKIATAVQNSLNRRAQLIEALCP